MFVKRKKSFKQAAEQRAYERVKVDAEVTIDSESNFYFGLTENVSEGGIFVSTFQPAPLGAELDVSFTLPGQAQPLSVRTRVQWVREHSPRNADVPPGIGLQFVDPSPELLTAVRSFIKTREPTFYED